MNEAIVRSLRDHCTIDAVTNKADCLDLLRSNTFEVIVAGERLEDGSGLELLSQIAKRWPAVLRIFAADRQRLKLLRGRLGPFDLFQTLAYPIDPDRLLAALALADAAQDPNADTANIEPPAAAEAEAEAAQTEGEVETQAARAGGRSASQAAASPQRHSRPRRTLAAVPPSTRAAAPGSARGPAKSNSRPASTSARGAVPPITRPASPSASKSRHGRIRSGTYKPEPVQFPVRDSQPPHPAEAATSITSSYKKPLLPPNFESDSLAAAAAMARTADSILDTPLGEDQSKRTLVLIGAGALAVLALVVLTVRIFGSSHEVTRPAAPVIAHQAATTQEVADLVAQIELSLTADDFKSAAAGVEKLRGLAPAHPRLAFFQSLIANNAKAGRSRATDPGSRTARTKRSPPPGAGAAQTTSTAKVAVSGSTPTSAAAATQSLPSSAAESAAADSTPAAASATSAEPAVATEPVTVSEPPPSQATVTPAQGMPSLTTQGTAPAASIPVAVTPKAETPARRAARSSDEPPPVIQEAKLIRRVAPDYPSAARRDAVAGSVDLEVTVSAEGAVTHVAVLASQPAGIFDRSAQAAVRKWKYDPRFVDGLPAEAHLKVHFDFKDGQVE